MELNRRDFLKGALTVGALGAGAGLVGCSTPAATDNTEIAETGSTVYPAGLQESDFAESPVEIEPITEFSEEKTYDVVVVGAGTGGVPAALSALEEGATVAVLQKESKPISQGGTCSGVLLDESDEQGVMNYIQGFMEDCGWRADRKLAETYAKYSGEAIRWTQVRTAEAGFPPYTVRPTAVAEYEDGSKCSRRSIVFGPKPYNNGTMIEHLADFAAEKGAEFFYSTPGVQLVTDDSGAVTGVIGKSGNDYIKFNATKGVILSTGDYQNNQSLVERYCPDVKEFDRKQVNKTGDGILMSMAVGAGFVPVGHSHMLHDFDSGPMFGEPFMTVNENGERFMNEDCIFEEINCVLRNQPKPGWYSQIFDDNYVEQVEGWGGKPTDKEKIQVYMPDVEMDRSAESGANVIEGLIDTYCCDTLDELAGKLGIPADTLKKSVERYNEMCDAGFDSDFGKAAKYLQKIEQPPYWGIHKHVRVSALCAGVTVNENYQATTAEGEVIPNLWVTGFSAGQLCGAPDWSMYQGGMSAGHCIMTGRICGIQAATGGKLEASTPITEADVVAISA
ncbi:FAD-dependent oxidoreductase [Adlercreutzia agrestimuris]|uniref:FAD-dependent oxidoreductase n=1 Tax=Adlercreutzia agrestimuris TaxID=2941324 RepID=UPI00203E0E42|nr:FAD-dependent oxidoreductase [Adlercreutzia agrestimuris]